MVLATLVVVSLTAQPTESYALVVTNNRSLQTHRADLRYADDDGVAFAQLFNERFGAGRTVLLTVLDETTKALVPGWSTVAPPTLERLDEAVVALQTSVRGARARGARSEVYLVFAGHGDVAEGSGYLELQDGRLTAGGLEQRVIRPLAEAQRLHLIVDSCNSFFLLNPRKPGGRRWAAEGLPTGDLSSRYPHLGTFVSTNAEAVSYEWSELQSGIFSYEVRSGLRGAADADGDGRVSYQELTAFVERANQDLPNAQYRPRVSAKPPRGDPDAVLIDLGQRVAGLTSATANNRRLTVRNAQGVRLADVHQEAGTPLRLLLPEDQGELGVYEQLPGEVRPRFEFRAVPPGFQGSLDDLTAAAPPLNARGEAPLLHRLFLQPFGKRAYAAHLASPPPPVSPAFGVTREDVQRLERTLQGLAEDDRAERTEWATLGAVLGNQPAATSLVLWEAVRVTEPTRLLGRLRAYDLSSDEARSRAIAVTERDFGMMAAASRSQRIGLSIVGLIAGAVCGGIGVAFSAQRDANGPAVPLVGVGSVVMLGGVIGLAWRGAIEREWEVYSTLR